MNIKQEYGLPLHLSGKSFADASKAIENTFKGRNSGIDLRTKQTFMSRLKDVQESIRQKSEMKQQQNQMANGGFEPLGMSMYNTLSTPEAQYWLQQQDRNKALTGNQQNTTNSIMSQPDDFIQDQTQLHNEKINPYAGGATFFDRTKDYVKNNQDSIMGGVGLAASAIAPLISNMMARKSMKRPSNVNPNLIDENQYQPNFVNRQQLLRNAAEQSASQRYFMSQSGGNQAQLSAMQGNLNANRLQSTGNLMLQSNLADQQELSRIQGMRGNIQQFNAGQRNRADEINAQNMAAYTGQQAAYKQAAGANIAAVGQSLFNAMQAKKYGQQMGYAATLKSVV